MLLKMGGLCQGGLVSGGLMSVHLLKDARTKCWWTKCRPVLEQGGQNAGFIKSYLNEKIRLNKQLNTNTLTQKYRSTFGTLHVKK